MKTTLTLQHAESNTPLLTALQRCDSFVCRLRGLMLRQNLPDDAGLLFVEPVSGRTSASIHMLFMRFAIAVVWLDDDQRVVDVALAKPWRLYYAPAAAARYVIEANPALLARVSIGDHLIWHENDF